MEIHGSFASKKRKEKSKEKWQVFGDTGNCLSVCLDTLSFSPWLCSQSCVSSLSRDGSFAFVQGMP